MPGLVETERLTHLLQSAERQRGGDGSQWRQALSGTPHGRAVMVEEVPAFTVSSRAGQLSGSVITVDAGADARNGNFKPPQTKSST